MGAFLVSLQVRIAWREGVPAAVKAVCRGASRVALTGDGWAGVYNERLDAQDDKEILRVGRALSKRLAASAAAFLVHDSDVLAIWTFDGGRVVDGFNSAPDYFGDASAPPPDHDATAAALASVAGVGAAAVRDVLAGEWAFAEQQLEALAALLGIDADAMTNHDGAAKLPGVVEVGRGRRKRRARAQPFAQAVVKVAMARFKNERFEAEPLDVSPDKLILRATEGAEMETWENHIPPDVDALLAAAADGPQAFARLILAEGVETATEAACGLANVGCIDVLRAMHARGFDLTRSQKYLHPPLSAAARANLPKTVAALLDLGLDANAETKSHTPLVVAILAGAGDAARVLLARGADPTAKFGNMGLRDCADLAKFNGKALPDDVLARLP